LSHCTIVPSIGHGLCAPEHFLYQYCNILYITHPFQDGWLYFAFFSSTAITRLAILLIAVSTFGRERRSSLVQSALPEIECVGSLLGIVSFEQSEEFFHLPRMRTSNHKACLA
jgi:hypothetical protein